MTAWMAVSPRPQIVRLRPWRLDDAQEIAVMAQDGHVRRWSSLPDNVETWLVRERAEHRGPSRAICLTGDDRALGKVALRLPGRLGADRREPSRVETDRTGVPRTLVGSCSRSLGERDRYPPRSRIDRQE